MEVWDRDGVVPKRTSRLKLLSITAAYAIDHYTMSSVKKKGINYPSCPLRRGRKNNVMYAQGIKRQCKVKCNVHEADEQVSLQDHARSYRICGSSVGSM